MPKAQPAAISGQTTSQTPSRRSPGSRTSQVRRGRRRRNRAIRQALANTLEALRHGVTTIDASAGGLGGCPYAKSATGNLATEDLLWQLDGLGIDTGVDMAKLCETSAWLARLLGRPSPSRTVRALTGS